MDHNELFLLTSQDDIPKLTEFRLFLEKEVEKIFMGMQSKTCELDPILTSIIKENLEKFLPTITALVNISLGQGVFATSWKLSIIKPLLKKIGLDIMQKSSFRPVSNLPFWSKVVEKCMLKRLNEHCDLHNLFPSYQSAYQQNFSCETVLIKLMTDILWAMENQCVMAMCAIDLSAVFDTVDHQVLISVLQHKYGVIDTALKWFDEYLRPCQCIVKIGNSTSDKLDLQFSVPQGSCAGANLFSIYSSTIKEVIANDIYANGYGDDPALDKIFDARSHEDEHETISRLENCISDIKVWMDKKS